MQDFLNMMHVSTYFQSTLAFAGFSWFQEDPWCRTPVKHLSFLPYCPPSEQYHTFINFTIYRKNSNYIYGMCFVLLIAASFLIIACASPQCSIEASNEICYHPEGIAIPNKLSNYKTYNEYHAQYEPTLGNVKNVTTIKDKNTGCISYIFLDSLQNFSLMGTSKITLFS